MTTLLNSAIILVVVGIIVIIDNVYWRCAD